MERKRANPRPPAPTGLDRLRALPAKRRAAVALFLLVAAFALFYTAYAATRGLVMATPGGGEALQRLGPLELLTTAAFAAWPLFAAWSALNGRAVGVALATFLYGAEGALTVYSVGGPHLVLGLPFMALGTSLYFLGELDRRGAGGPGGPGAGG